jgi:hypothetical protein
MPETWWEYVERHAGRDSPNKAIAVAAGVNASQISRWREGDTPSARPVINFARYYRRPPTEALIAAGYLNPDEAAGIAQLTMSVRDLAPDVLVSEIGSLVAELRRRVPGDQSEDWGEGGAGWIGNPPMFQQHSAVRRRQG